MKIKMRLLRTERIYRVEKNYLTKSKGKCLVITGKSCKNQVKRKFDRILHGVSIHIIFQRQPNRKQYL